MFSFFRRYQRAIYFVITAVIILSFSFFGTYTTFTSGKGDDPVVFTTKDGRQITRSECNDFVHFLSMDSLSLGEGGATSCNPLNDGVIANDIIASGIGELLVKRFSQSFQQEWLAKLRREKTFQPYQHPQAPYVSAHQAWSYFAPGLKDSLESYQSIHSEDGVELFHKKTELYLAERGFPPVYLRQVLSYQQQQLSWLEPDTSLAYRPLGLFGYQQITDWFGVPFIEKVCEFIMDVASVARMQGYTVSTDEVLASLYQNAQKSLQKIPRAEGLTAGDLVKKTLQECNIDQVRAVKIWTDVMLFRRALMDLPLQIVLNKEPFNTYLQYQHEAADLACYQVQPCLRLSSMYELMARELWFTAVGEKSEEALHVPQTFKSPAEVVTSWPEFVSRHVLLSVSSVSSDELAKRIRLRDMWNWEADEANWTILQKEIPQLSEKDGADRDARLRAVEELPVQLREKIDKLAKNALILLHPEWREEALAAAKPESIMVGLRLRGGEFPFEGITDRGVFINELMNVPVGEVSSTLSAYSQDQNHFYRIIVQDRSAQDSLVPLPDLIEDGTLTAVLDRVLEAKYSHIRTERPADFKNAKGEWKSFKEVKDRVGELYYAPLMRSLDQAIALYCKQFPRYCQWDDVKTARVSVRFLPHLLRMYDMLVQDESMVVTSEYLPMNSKEVHMEDRPLSDLFLLVTSKQHIARFDEKEKPQLSEALQTSAGSWMPPRYSQEFGPFVGKVVSRGEDDYSKVLREMVFGCQKMVGKEAVCTRAQQLIEECL